MKFPKLLILFNNYQLHNGKLRNILLDHYETPINATLSTPSQLKNHYNGTDSNKSSPANSSHIKKMEDYITEKYDEIALDHLQSKILKEVTQISGTIEFN